MDKVTDIFFDLDDTLWDFQKNFTLTFEYIFAQNDYGMDLQEFLKVFIPINQKYWRLYREGKTDQFNLHKRRFEETFKQFEGALTSVEGEQIFKGYTLYNAAFTHLIPGTLEALEYLHNSYNLHILTDGFFESQVEKLKNAEIHDYFNTITASDEVGITKPHPKIFDEALKKANTQKENSVMIGDNLDFDVFGAIDAGLEAIFFTPTGDTAYKGKQITSIKELKTIL